MDTQSCIMPSCFLAIFGYTYKYQHFKSYYLSCKDASRGVVFVNFLTYPNRKTYNREYYISTVVFCFIEAWCLEPIQIIPNLRA